MVTSLSNHLITLEVTDVIRSLSCQRINDIILTRTTMVCRVLSGSFKPFKLYITYTIYIIYTIYYIRQEHWLRVFKNKILRRIFGPKRGENGEWRRLYSEEIKRFYRDLI